MRKEWEPHSVWYWVTPSLISVEVVDGLGKRIGEVTEFDYPRKRMNKEARLAAAQEAGEHVARKNGLPLWVVFEDQDAAETAELMEGI